MSKFKKGDLVEYKSVNRKLFVLVTDGESEGQDRFCGACIKSDFNEEDDEGLAGDWNNNWYDGSFKLSETDINDLFFELKNKLNILEKSYE